MLALHAYSDPTTCFLYPGVCFAEGLGAASEEPRGRLPPLQPPRYVGLESVQKRGIPTFRHAQFCLTPEGHKLCVEFEEAGPVRRPDRGHAHSGCCKEWGRNYLEEKGIVQRWPCPQHTQSCMGTFEHEINMLEKQWQCAVASTEEELT